ncbi:MAG: acetate--CoA ligase family protein [Candidatus Latescibacteria bacterium]|nr:acetate--CoA ligase family protein [Candidatus Latescibacterota bacterium]
MSLQRQASVHETLSRVAAAAGPCHADRLRLNEAEVYDLLEAIGLAACPRLAGGREQAAGGKWAAGAAALADAQGRLVLKVLGRDILHKSDVGGVAVLELPAHGRAEAVTAAAGDLLRRVEAAGSGSVIEGVLATAFVPHRANVPGQEVLLSVRLDPAFGPVVVIGVGGVLTEWYGRGTAGRSRLILPAAGLTPQRAAAAVAGHPLLSLLCRPSRLYPQPPLAPLALGEAAAALAGLAVATGPAADSDWTLEELEINPAVIRDGALVAIDGVALLSHRRWPAPNRPLARIGELLHPRSAAVLGASARGDNPGRVILNNLKRSRGVAPERLHVVHPKESAIDGVACVPSVQDLPAKVDLAVVCIPAAGARDAIAEIVAHDRAASIILIPGGFAEAGETGLADEIERILAGSHDTPGGGPVMVGGNCLGIVSRDSYNTFFLPLHKLPFSEAACGRNLAVVSQSGAYLVTFASNYDGIVNPAASISFGNQMDLTAADFLAHFLEADGIDVVACYIEGFRPGDGDRFVELARRATARGKQVLVFKAGKTELGAKAAASHTASLAGDYDVALACLEDAGVTVASTLDEFEDLIKTFTMLMPRPARGPRVGILSNAGFECSTVTDALGGLELRGFDAGVRAVLDAALPAFAHRDNPVDATPMAGTAAYADAVAAILASDGVDAAIISAVPVTPALDNLPAAPGLHGEDLDAPGSLAGRLVPLLAGGGKPAVIVVDSGPLYDPLCARFELAGVPVFRKIDRAARALACFVAACARTAAARPLEDR